MNEAIKPCPFRSVNGEGQILCQLIKGPDHEITLDICRACPVSQINCQHLRASLEKQESNSLVVRFVTGRTEVWNDNPPAVTIKRAACAEKAMPIQSPRDCSGCPIRLPQFVPQGVIHAAREHANRGVALNPPANPVSAVNVIQASAQIRADVKKTKPRPAPKPVEAIVPSTQPAPVGAIQSKVIQIEKWLSAQMQKKGSREIENPDIVQDIPTRPTARMKQASPAQPMAESVEKCVGWTD
ncbi:MAG TPA: hypothetical protein VIX58_13310 [Anaerolineae bacterium]